MRRLIGLLAALLPLTFLVNIQAVCADNGKIIELKVNQLPDFSAQDYNSRAETAVIRRFLEKYPNVRLIRGTGLKIQGTATMDMVPLMQIAGDISPAVIYVNFRMSDTYIQKGFLRPLDDYIAKEMTPEELDSRVPPAAKEVMYREGPDGKKHWYMLPTGSVTRVLMYRRDKFAKAGLDPDKPPRTWEELEEYCKKLRNPTTGQYGIAFTKGDVSSWDFVNLVWSRGGDIIVQNEKGEWQPTFDTPEMTDALYYYTILNKLPFKWKDGKTYTGLAYRDQVVDVNNVLDNYAMAFAYLRDTLNQFDPQRVGYAPIPYPKGEGRSASEINCTMLGIYNGVQDPDVALAAYRYIAFLNSDEANEIRCKTYIQRGYGKFINPVLLERFGYTDYLKQVDSEWVTVYKDAMVNGKPEPYGKNCANVYRELSRPIEQAINDPVVLAAIKKGDEATAKKRIRQILRVAQAETEKRMYGVVPAPVAKVRRSLTIGFLVAAFVGFTMVSLFLFRMFRRSAPPQVPGQKKVIIAYLLLVPAVLTVLTWQYYPLLRGTMIAFQDYNIAGGTKWLGVANFTEVLFDAGFWYSVYITLVYTALYMGFGFLSPIALALLLSEVPRGKMFFRTMFYMPAVLSGLVVIFLWKSFYTATGLLNTLIGRGADSFAWLINNSLGWAGVHWAGLTMSESWLDNPALAMICVLLPIIWAGMGPGCLIYLAAFKTIPEDFYEAAEVDGAGILRKIFGITLPSIKMLILINAVGAFIGAFMTSEMIFAMTGGGPYTPYGSTEVVGLQLFYTAFMYLKFGVANAMAWILGFMLIGFTMFQLRNLSRVEFKGGR